MFDFKDIKVRHTPSQATESPKSLFVNLKLLLINIFNPFGLFVIFVTTLLDCK